MILVLRKIKAWERGGGLPHCHRENAYFQVVLVLEVEVEEGGRRLPTFTSL